MSTTPLRTAAAAVIGATVLALATGPATASSLAASDDGTQAPATQLALTMPPSTHGGEGGTVTVTCEPTGGTHPDPQSVCDKLAEVNGDFTRLPAAPGVGCPDVWDPVTIIAAGHWGESPVFYEETFSNACDAAVETNLIFDF